MIKYSLVVPVYKNEASVPGLLDTLTELHKKLEGLLEVVLVVDGSPDNSYRLLSDKLHTLDFPVQLLLHSRNFGALLAKRTGLLAARGKYLAVMSADLQEPQELIIDFFQALCAGECDVVIGARTARHDPFPVRFFSFCFWALYRYLVLPDMPKGGVDVFGCNRVFCEQLLQLEESRSSFISLVFWLGFRRKFIGYERQPRLEGKSAWTFSRKLDYMMDSIFSFTDLPVRLLLRLGGAGLIISMLLIVVVMVTGGIFSPSGIIVFLMFFGSLNLLGLGLVGTYTWRAYENTKKRPLAVIAKREENNFWSRKRQDER